jgi:short-subunit dehydrogenase
VPTALVTGATAGIGAAFARRLASERYDLVLVARGTARLESSAQALRSAHPVAVDVLPADLGTEDGCRRVESRLAAGGVEMLVNNAGISTLTAFDQTDVEDEERVLRVNVRALMRLSRAALPRMLAAGRGDIVNVSSVAGFVPTAGGASYAATKAYVTALSEGLAVSYGPRGVRLMALCPGFTRTEFHARAGLPTQGIPERMWLSADDVVDAGLRDLRRGLSVSVPAARYKTIVAVSRVLPRRAMASIGRLAQRRRGRP